MNVYEHIGHISIDKCAARQMCIINFTKHSFVLDCGNVTVTNGQFEAPSGTIYGQIATLACDIGFTLSGEETIICTDSKEWNVTSLTCNLVGKYLIRYMFP
jgi:hypothetical protein